MSDIRQITDKLNSEFTESDFRRLVFWYDSEGEFSEDIDSLNIENAKIYRLEENGRFAAKYFLEREDTETNYLIYAPFPRPALADDPLADMLLYSKEFFADRISMLMLDLDMDEGMRPVIKRYLKFFQNKQRLQAFTDLDIGQYNRASVELGMMSVLCRCRIPAFEEILRTVLDDNDLTCDNPFLVEFGRYDLTDAFWEQCTMTFGYADEQPSLTKLLATLFVSYADKTIHAELPRSWQPYVSFKSGTIMAFLDNMMNSVVYSERFDVLSGMMYEALDGKKLERIPVEALIDCNLFSGIDSILLSWMADRLLYEDIDTTLDGMTIPQICAARRKLHFGPLYHDAYFVIENAWYIIRPKSYTYTESIDSMTDAYITELYKIDRRYRYFYYYYDRLENNGPYERVRALVERVYTNDYLDPLISEYSCELEEIQGHNELPMQYDFYEKKIRTAKERVAVIISDALRYEVGVSLFERLQADEKCTAELSVMQSVIPSVTRLGMAALLPHRTFTVVDADHALCDGMPANDIKQREAILKKARPNSRAVRYDDIKGMTVEELRGVFARQEVVYIYHNQIDARGDKHSTENEVFVACEEAIEEIAKLIRRLTTSANTTRFIVTSDHGFIYKRDKLTPSDKISGIKGANDRYIITQEPLSEKGICTLPLGVVCGTEDSRSVNCPVGSDLFSAHGSGKNYVHGGCSPQETLIPLIEVRTDKSKRETTFASIDLLSLLGKITNLITVLDIIQTEPVSDIVKETTYRVYFVSDSGEIISNINVLHANKKDSETSKRITRLRFSLKNRRYDKDGKYYLVAVDPEDHEVMRREVIIDPAFSDDV